MESYVIKLWRHSVAFKLSSPIVVVGILLVAVIYGVVRAEGRELTQKSAVHLADLLVDSIVLGAQINGSNSNVVRLVNALSVYRELEFVALIDEQSETILAASKNKLIGQAQGELAQHTLALPLLEKIDRLENVHFIEDGSRFHMAARIKLYDPASVSLRDMTIIFVINSQAATGELARALNLTVWVLVVSIVSMLFASSWVQQRVLFRRLSKFNGLIASEVEKLGTKKVIQSRGDEIDAIQINFLTLLQEKHEADIERELALESAEASNQAKSDFLANMSHELRTPLNSIIGFSKRILKTQDNLNERQAHSLGVINRSGEHLLHLINDILDLTKIDAGRMEITPHETDLVSLCKFAVDELNEAARSKGLRLTLNTTGQVIACVDELRIRQVMLNLISNAIKYSDQGEIVVAIKTLEETVEICVEDTGIGIKEVDKQRLFKRFEQFDNQSRMQIGKGSGLGLYIVNEFVRLHKGWLKVESEYGRGSRFYVYLPYRADQQQPITHLGVRQTSTS